MSPRLTLSIFVSALLVGCAPTVNDPQHGPDQQGSGVLSGAALGAGSGAVTGFQVGAGTGPGAVVGAGLGVVYGALSGLGLDILEEDQIARTEKAQKMREISWAQEILSEHYRRRLELHPNRDIFPADLFFYSDSSKLRCESEALVREIAKLTTSRMPWSRIVIASYIASSESAPTDTFSTTYASSLGQKRADEIAREFIRNGIEARRVLTQAVTVTDPVLIDPYDSPDRYRQAIEIIPLDY